MGGSLEVAVLLLGWVRRGIDSANCTSCLSILSSSFEGILMSILSGCPSLLLSSMSLWSDLSPLMGPHSLRSMIWYSRMSRLYSPVGSLLDSQQLFCVLYLTRYQKPWVKLNSIGKYVPFSFMKYPVLSPTVAYTVSWRYLLGTLHSPLQLSGSPFLNTFSALDAFGRFDLMSQDDSLWLDLA